MAKKRTNSKKSVRTKSEKKSQDLEKNSEVSKEVISKIAKDLLTGNDKNPYYYGSIVIQNLDELQNHLHNFSEHEAGWLADWIDYLGDNHTAIKIRENPNEFKTIINERYLELKKLKER